MRLLSFLTEIERAVLMEANAAEGAVWNSTRIVNFQTGLARLTLSLRPEAEPGMPEGTILVQHFGIANGSFCVKAQLQWKDSRAVSTLAVYDVPQLNWKIEAARIASTWLNGAPAVAESTDSDVERLAVAG